MWEEVPRAFCGATFDICLLGLLKGSGPAGCVAYVLKKWAAICVRNGGSVGVILFIIMSVHRVVSGIRINFWVCFAIFLWGSLGNVLGKACVLAV